MSLAYRMLGTPDDADDVVQDVWFRWDDAHGRGDVDNPAAWLTTVTTRLAIDRLRSARRRREVYVGPWLPEPLPPGTETDVPSSSAVAAESLTLGFLAVLERLQPVERAVFLLHDVFGYPFTEVAATVERSEAATRQIAHRARQRVQADRVRVDPDPDRVEQLADAFLGAMLEGDVDALRALLTEDVVHVSDGGADRRAARRPVVGAHRVARLMVNLASRVEPGTELHPVIVNGQYGWYATMRAEPLMVLVPSFHGGRVSRLHAVLNPDKLARFHRAWLAARR